MAMQARADHLLIQIPPDQTETKGGLVLPDVSNQKKFYGRIVSIGPEVTDSSLKVGQIAVFDANGMRVVTLSQLSSTMLVAISYMQLFMTADDEDLEREGVPIPEQLDALQERATA